MFDWVYKLSNLYFTKPSVSYLPVKSLNVFFKNAKEPKFLFLDLKDVSSLSFEIEVVKGETDNSYKLVAIKNTIERIDLAAFNSREKAENGLEIIKAKIFGVEKAIFKVSFMAIFVVFVLGLILDVLLVQFGKVMVQKELSNRAASQQMQFTPNGVPQLPQGLSAEEINQLVEEVRNNIGMPPGVENPVPSAPNQPQAPQQAQPQAPSSPGDDFLRSLQR